MTRDDLREQAALAAQAALISVVRQGQSGMRSPEVFARVAADAVLRVALKAAAGRATAFALVNGSDPADVTAAMHGEGIAIGILALMPEDE